MQLDKKEVVPLFNLVGPILGVSKCLLPENKARISKTLEVWRTANNIKRNFQHFSLLAAYIEQSFLTENVYDQSESTIIINHINQISSPS